MSFNFRSGRTGFFNSPSTPNRKAGKSSLSQAPSTTPAGEPPSYLTNVSTTPAERPPRSSKLFGSSYNAANNTFGHRNPPGRRGWAFALPESSPPPAEEDEEQDAEGEIVDEGYGTQTAQHAPDVTFLESFGTKDSPRGLKRSRKGEVRSQLETGMTDIARSYAQLAGPASLHQSDDIVLQTENVLSDLDGAVQEQGIAGRDQAITSAVTQLTHLWAQNANVETRQGSIGPHSDDAFTKANYLATLLLQLHNPHQRRNAQTSSVLGFKRALTNPQQDQSSSIPMPGALLDWLNTFHKPLGDDFNEIHMHRPSPSAHESFWDLIGGELLRGRLARVIRLLKDAGFENAVTAVDDGAGRTGYRGKQLENVEEVVTRFLRLLERCPAVKYNDWDIKGVDWSVFRQQVRNAIRDLEAFAKGNDGEADDLLSESQRNVFAQSADEPKFGSMASASMRAGSRVPWSIYENLKTLYGVLLGGDEIVDYAQDWLESSIFLTVWWDGEGDEAPNSSLAGRSSLRRSRVAGGTSTREVDVSPLTAYRRRLGDMLRTVTEQIEEANFKPDTLDPVQVGLVCVMDDSVEVVIELLRTWDQTIATAVVEIASLDGWLPLARPSSRGLLKQGFSSDDLMVLSHGPGHQTSANEEGVDRDEVLPSYADLLAGKDICRSSDGKTQREGWELAVSILGRLDDHNVAQTKISALLETLQFEDEARVDKVLDLCSSMGLSEQARGLAEVRLFLIIDDTETESLTPLSQRYADTLAKNNPSSYGSALIYYARAHATSKLKSTISFLISLCLLQSATVPTSNNLDSQLSSLLNNERTTLVGLANADLSAATLLSGQISGYATVRKFYELRDNRSGPSKSLQRKREAAKALIALIESASDCIRGGLFDSDVQSVVPIDGLLGLLGETLPLLGQEKRIFTKQQVFTLMRVVEDFETAPARIREGAVELVQASMNAYRATSSSTQLKKGKSNVSSMSGSGLSGSSWDMVLSSNILQSLEIEEDSGMTRSWDWRKGLDAVVGARVESKEVLMLLRVALGQEVAKGWSGAIGW